MTNVRRTPAPRNRLGSAGRAHQLVIMLLCAVFALSGGAMPARAGVDAVARGLAAKSLSGNAAQNAIPGVYNFDPAYLPHYRAALAKALSGGGTVRIAFIGDSLTMGAGSGTGGTTNQNNAKVTSYPATIGKLFASAGFNVAQDGIFGDNYTPDTGVAAVASYDPKVTFTGTNWSRSALALAGNLFNNTNGNATDVMSYQPAVATDKIDVYYATNTTFGTFQVLDGSTVLATVNSNGSGGFVKVSYTRTKSTNPVKIQSTATGGQFFVAGIDTWDSTSAQVRLANLGAYGATGILLASAGSPWSPLNALPKLAYDLYVIGEFTNDYRTGVTSASSRVALQSQITALKAIGADVVLLWQVPDSTPVNPTIRAEDRQVMRDLAVANSIPMIDMESRYVSYANMQAQGNYADTVHQTAQGYADIAMSVWRVLRPQ